MELLSAWLIAGFTMLALTATSRELAGIRKELVKHNALCEKAAGLQSDWHLYN